MNAAPTTAALPNAPDPDPADQDTTPVPLRVSLVLGLLRKLIGYGKELAQTLKQGAATQFVLTVAMHFGTRDLALILRRIARGIRLATALEADLVNWPMRGYLRLASEEKRPPCTAPAAKSQPRPPLPDLPTEAEIAEAIRTRRIGALIVQICSDFGIGWEHPLFHEIADMVAEFGGDLAGMVNVCKDPAGFWRSGPPAQEPVTEPAGGLPPSPQPTAFTTGPPPVSLAA